MVDYGLKGETALVLGGTRGLGLACATSLAEAGVRVLINGRDAAHGTEVAAGLGAKFLAGDVSAAADRDRVLEAAAAEGPVSILVTNAGGPPPGQFLETPIDAWPRAFELS